LAPSRQFRIVARTIVKTNADTQREFAIDVVRRLRAAGFDALWAGGCVRDQLLGREPKDYDVATSALPDQVRDLFGKRRTLAIGASFGVITVLGPKACAPIEVATFRSDGEYLDGRRPTSVAYTDAEHDARRRDFTINGLFFDPLDERVVDYVGGQADLAAKVVRAIGDPRRRFEEDKLRMLRAVRFAATYEFALDAATLDAIREMSGEVIAVSGERIGAELRRVLVHPTRQRGAELMAKANLWQPLCPELAVHAATADDAWQAALRRLAKLEAETLPPALAALVYDMLDEQQARDFGRRLRFTNKEIDRTDWLLKQLPVVLQAGSLAWPRLQRLLVHDGASELVALLAAIAPPNDPALARCLEKLALDEEVRNPPPLATGNDLMAHGLAAGRHFAELLDFLRDEQLEGRIRTRDEALAEAARWVKLHGSE
jgi:tRNA nucleotidyltransferase/poly(A) polymerase